MLNVEKNNFYLNTDTQRVTQQERKNITKCFINHHKKMFFHTIKLICSYSSDQNFVYIFSTIYIQQQQRRRMEHNPIKIK